MRILCAFANEQKAIESQKVGAHRTFLVYILCFCSSSNKMAESGYKQEQLKTLWSSPTKHFTESSFLLVSDPLEDLNFRFFGLSFFQQIFMKKVGVQSYQHIQRQIRKKKIESKNTPKKLRVQATKHFTESSFLLVSDFLEDLNFRFFGLSFFQQIFMKKVTSPELPEYSAADSPEKDRVQKHPKKGKSPAPQNTSHNPVFSSFHTLLKI